MIPFYHKCCSNVIIIIIIIIIIITTVFMSEYTNPTRAVSVMYSER